MTRSTQFMMPALKLSLALAIICSSTFSFAQSRKLIESFKIADSQYNIYTINSAKTASANDTVFYIVSAAGSKKVLAKEIKDVLDPGKTKLVKGGYALNKESVVFKIESPDRAAEIKTYLGNKDGLRLQTASSSSGAAADESLIMISRPSENNDTTVPKVYQMIEVKPEYPGGHEMMYKFIGSNLKYPKAAVKANIQGTVYTEFTVEADGKIAGIKFNRSIGYGTDEAVIRVLKKMPRWKPAQANGKPVATQYSLPFSFKLSN